MADQELGLHMKLQWEPSDHMQLDGMKESHTLMFCGGCGRKFYCRPARYEKYTYYEYTTKAQGRFYRHRCDTRLKDAVRCNIKHFLSA